MHDVFTHASLVFQYMISFALNLSIPADKVLQVKKLSTDSNKSGSLSKDGQNDEADAGRTQVPSL